MLMSDYKIFWIVKLKLSKTTRKVFENKKCPNEQCQRCAFLKLINLSPGHFPPTKLILNDSFNISLFTGITKTYYSNTL